MSDYLRQVIKETAARMGPEVPRVKIPVPTKPKPKPSKDQGPK